MALELVNIIKKVDGVDHLSDVTLKFEPGSFNTLLGSTLSGKTTLLRLMAGLEKPTSGTIMMNGTDTAGQTVRSRSVAFVYQQFINYPGFSVFDNIASPLKVERQATEQIRERVQKIAELLSIDHLLERKPLELSGGQQQRVALGRALVKGAELVLLDEPLANLDYKLREELRAELPRLFAGSGSIVIYATAEPEEALLLGGQVAVLHEGRVQQAGPTAEVYRSPTSLQAARTFSDPPLNTIAATKSGGSIALPGTEIPAGASNRLQTLEDGEFRLGFRPHQLRMHQTGARSVAINAQVILSEITGSESFIHVDALGERWTALAHGIHNHAMGSALTLYLDPDDLFVFDPDGKPVAGAPVSGGEVARG